MKSKHILALIATTAAFVALPALAQDVSYRKDIAPLIKKQCAECHGADAPTYKEFTFQTVSKTQIGADWLISPYLGAGDALPAGFEG